MFAPPRPRRFLEEGPHISNYDYDDAVDDDDDDDHDHRHAVLVHHHHPGDILAHLNPFEYLSKFGNESFVV